MGAPTTTSSAIDVAVFDAGRLVMTRSCRGVTEARSVMDHIGSAGYDCLIVSSALRDALARDARH